MRTFFVTVFAAVILLAGFNASAQTDMIPASCRLLKRGAGIDADYCGSGMSNMRCFADVEYRSGRQQRFWGERCVNRAPDCGSKRDDRVHPSCLNIEDLR